MIDTTTIAPHRNTVQELVGNPSAYHRDGSRKWKVRVALARGRKESSCVVQAATRERALAAAVRMYKEWRSQKATALDATPWPEGDDWVANAKVDFQKGARSAE